MGESGSNEGQRVSRPTAIVRRVSDHEALVTWQQMSRGQWAVLDRVDDGHGRRFVLAQLETTNERPWHRLSAREKTVVAAVAAGQTNREIASVLGVSISTVAGHLRSARKKLGGARRLDLVREWDPARDGVRVVRRER